MMLIGGRSVSARFNSDNQARPARAALALLYAEGELSTTEMAEALNLSYSYLHTQLVTLAALELVRRQYVMPGIRADVERPVMVWQITLLGRQLYDTLTEGE